MSENLGSETRAVLERRKCASWIVAAILLHDLPDDAKQLAAFQKRLDRKWPHVRHFAKQVEKSLGT